MVLGAPAHSASKGGPPVPSPAEVLALLGPDPGAVTGPYTLTITRTTYAPDGSSAEEVTRETFAESSRLFEMLDPNPRAWLFTPEGVWLRAGAAAWEEAAGPPAATATSSPWGPGTAPGPETVVWERPGKLLRVTWAATPAGTDIWTVDIRRRTVIAVSAVDAAGRPRWREARTETRLGGQRRLTAVTVYAGDPERLTRREAWAWELGADRTRLRRPDAPGLTLSTRPGQP